MQVGLLFKSMALWFCLLIELLFYIEFTSGRKHHLEVISDIRPYIALSTFGFYVGGNLDVKLSKLVIENEVKNDLSSVIGLSLDKTSIDQMNPYLDSHQTKCILQEDSVRQRSGPILFFLLDLEKLEVKVQCSPEWKNVHIYKDRSLAPTIRGKRHSYAEISGDSTLFLQRKRRTADKIELLSSDDDNILSLNNNTATFNFKASSPIDRANKSNKKFNKPLVGDIIDDDAKQSKVESTIQKKYSNEIIINLNKKSSDSEISHKNISEKLIHSEKVSNKFNAPIEDMKNDKEFLKTKVKTTSEEIMNIKAAIKNKAMDQKGEIFNAKTNINSHKILQVSENKKDIVDAVENTVNTNEKNALNGKKLNKQINEQDTIDDSNSLKPNPSLLEDYDGPPNIEYIPENKERNRLHICNGLILPLSRTIINKKNHYNMSFYMLVTSLADEGLYNLYFHACPNYKKFKRMSFVVDIEEENNGNYLSAGEMPLPALYFMMSILFFLSGLFWVFLLNKSKHTVFKIHYIMAVLVFLKSLSLMFHSINYYFIQTRGEHVEAWAILYYIAHLLKGAVLFITIVLIGTGWTFIKHILSDKDKKIFMIVIPLQVLANVSKIIIDESEESDVEFRTWRNIFIFVDLICCGAILFPIVWSIRHLHEASATDGKAAINLRKLKLFRQFYIMIVCYIYFTRIIVYLLKMTVAFQYAWLDEMFHEMATYVFFVLTGYKFRPVSSHPYFALGNQDVDYDEVEILTESNLSAGLHRKKPQNRSSGQTTTIIEGCEEERENLITKRESSHEYD